MQVVGDGASRPEGEAALPLDVPYNKMAGELRDQSIKLMAGIFILSFILTKWSRLAVGSKIVAHRLANPCASIVRAGKFDVVLV